MQGSTYRRYLLGVLLLVLAFNSVDRLALGLLLQAVKVDLRLTDTQLGFMTGIAFALFYSLMGIPIARWADRGNRALIISLTTALWSCAVVLCGTAANFTQLLLFRVAVAVGEAGGTAPAHSLIADFFTRAERARAMATYMLGGALANVIGYFLAGWLNELYGWRQTFVLLGLPGLGLAALAWFVVREPRRQKRTHGSGGDTPGDLAHVCPGSSGTHASLKEVVVTLWANRTFRRLLYCFSVIYFFSYGIGYWQPTFFARSFGLGTGALGTWFAAIGVASFFGIYWGGDLATRYAANDERLQLRIIAVACCIFGALAVCIYLSPNHYVALTLWGIAMVGIGAVNGPLFAMIQTLVPPRMRATSVAVIYLFANLIGMGLGPLAVGSLSDALRPTFGEESLRYALLAMCPGYVWGAWYFWQASHTVSGDLPAASSEAS